MPGHSWSLCGSVIAVIPLLLIFIPSFRPLATPHHTHPHQNMLYDHWPSRQALSHLATLLSRLPPPPPTPIPKPPPSSPPLVPMPSAPLLSNSHMTSSCFCLQIGVDKSAESVAQGAITQLREPLSSTSKPSSGETDLPCLSTIPKVFGTKLKLCWDCAQLTLHYYHCDHQYWYCCCETPIQNLK